MCFLSRVQGQVRFRQFRWMVFRLASRFWLTRWSKGSLRFCITQRQDISQNSWVDVWILLSFRSDRRVGVEPTRRLHFLLRKVFLRRPQLPVCHDAHIFAVHNHANHTDLCTQKILINIQALVVTRLKVAVIIVRGGGGSLIECHNSFLAQRFAKGQVFCFVLFFFCFFFTITNCTLSNGCTLVPPTQI